MVCFFHHVIKPAARSMLNTCKNQFANLAASLPVCLYTLQEPISLLLQEELGLYGAGLTEKPALLIANKADKVPEAAAAAAVKELEAETGVPTVLVSGHTGQGVEELKTRLRQLSPTDVPL